MRKPRCGCFSKLVHILIGFKDTLPAPAGGVSFLFFTGSADPSWPMISAVQIYAHAPLCRNSITPCEIRNFFNPHHHYPRLLHALPCIVCRPASHILYKLFITKPLTVGGKVGFAALIVIMAGLGVGRTGAACRSG